MEISIIIPCRNEGINVETITERIVASISIRTIFEIIFVDDSDDDTPSRLEKLSNQYPLVRYLHRDDGRGLSTAVIEGFKLARGQWFIVMDADMQHPPESLPTLIDEIRREEADIIVPSRFIPGGSDGGLNLWRKLVSWTARMMARLLIRKVRTVTDPTSGYFAVRRETAFSTTLDPIGWKILLELLARSEFSVVREIPYRFNMRDLGSSKLNLHEQVRYIQHLIRLIRSNEADSRFWRFCIVGMSGVVVNMAVYIPLVQLDISVGLAFAYATMTAMTSNFIWNNLLTWSHKKLDSLWYRFIKFTLVSLSGMGISSILVTAVHNLLGMHYVIAGFSGIIVSTGWNYFINNEWTFKRKAYKSESYLGEHRN